MTAARLLARTVRGIESIVADELVERRLGRVLRVGHRDVLFEPARLGPDLLSPRCADDVLLVAATLDGIGRRRDSLRELARTAERLPLRQLLERRERCGGGPFATVDVSASFVGRRNYNRYDIEDAVGGPLSAALGRPYRGRRDGVAPPTGGLSFRVTIDGERATVAVRIADRPLHRRPYRLRSTPGSLHPPVAQALVRMANPAPGERLLDPCCGSGTIPLEAPGTLHRLGVDSSAAALAAADVNDAAGAVRWWRADAGELPVRTGSIDVVVSNPPWDRQVPPSGRLAHDPGRFWAELSRVLRPGGRAVLLLPERAAGPPPAAELLPGRRRPISLSGRHPVVTTFERSRH